MKEGLGRIEVLERIREGKVSRREEKMSKYSRSLAISTYSKT